MKKPLISVVMPVYNNEDFVEEAIKSILNQSYKNFELIVIDDGSTDNTASIVKNLSKRDKRIILLQNKENRKISYSLNKGIKNSKGDYIARMDGDDICEINRLKLELDYLDKHPDIDLVYTDLIYIDGDGTYLGKRSYDNSKFNKTIKIESPVAHATVLFKKNILEKSGLYKEEFSGAEDFDLWIRMFMGGVKFGHINKKLYSYRMQDQSTKFRGIKKQIKKVIAVKENAVKKYKFKLGFRGNLRLFIEKSLLLFPEWIVILIYKMVYIK